MATLKDIQQGIESYKKTYPDKYKKIENFVNPLNACVTFAKIESSMNEKAKGKDGEVGMYQFLPSTLKAIIQTYSKNVQTIYNLYLQSAVSQTFVFMQSLYVYISKIEQKKTFFHEYETFMSFFSPGIKKYMQIALLHNQGDSAFTRLASKWDCRFHYLPQVSGVLNFLGVV